MGTNLLIIGVLVIALFGIGIWVTISEFKNIDKTTTKRRKHLENDMNVENKNEKN